MMNSKDERIDIAFFKRFFPIFCHNFENWKLEFETTTKKNSFFLASHEIII